MSAAEARQAPWHPKCSLWQAAKRVKALQKQLQEKKIEEPGSKQGLLLHLPPADPTWELGGHKSAFSPAARSRRFGDSQQVPDCNPAPDTLREDELDHCVVPEAATQACLRKSARAPPEAVGSFVSSSLEACDRGFECNGHLKSQEEPCQGALMVESSSKEGSAAEMQKKHAVSHSPHPDQWQLGTLAASAGETRMNILPREMMLRQQAIFEEQLYELHHLLQRQQIICRQLGLGDVSDVQSGQHSGVPSARSESSPMQTQDSRLKKRPHFDLEQQPEEEADEGPAADSLSRAQGRTFSPPGPPEAGDDRQPFCYSAGAHEVRALESSIGSRSGSDVTGPTMHTDVAATPTHEGYSRNFQTTWLQAADAEVAQRRSNLLLRQPWPAMQASEDRWDFAMERKNMEAGSRWPSRAVGLGRQERAMYHPGYLRHPAPAVAPPSLQTSFCWVGDGRAREVACPSSRHTRPELMSVVPSPWPAFQRPPPLVLLREKDSKEMRLISAAQHEREKGM